MGTTDHAMAACAVPMTLLCRTESGRRQLKRMDLGGEESGGPVRLAKPEPAASKACSDRGTRSAASEVRVAIKRSEEHTSELQSLMRISYAVFCLKKKKHRDTEH